MTKIILTKVVDIWMMFDQNVNIKLIVSLYNKIVCLLIVTYVSGVGGWGMWNMQVKK